MVGCRERVNNSSVVKRRTNHSVRFIVLEMWSKENCHFLRAMCAGGNVLDSWKNLRGQRHSLRFQHLLEVSAEEQPLGLVMGYVHCLQESLHRQCQLRASMYECLRAFSEPSHIVPSVLWHCWLGGRKCIRPVKTWVAWLSVWSEVQMICIWSSWCHCHLTISCFIKIQNSLPFWCRLTQVFLEKRPLNRCSVVVYRSLLWPNGRPSQQLLSSC